MIYILHTKCYMPVSNGQLSVAITLEAKYGIRVIILLFTLYINTISTEDRKLWIMHQCGKFYNPI